MSNRSVMGYESRIEIKSKSLGIITKNTGTQNIFDFIVDSLTGYTMISNNKTSADFDPSDMETLKTKGILKEVTIGGLTTYEIADEYKSMLSFAEKAASYTIPQNFMIYSSPKNVVLETPYAHNFVQVTKMNEFLLMRYETSLIDAIPMGENDGIITGKILKFVGTLQPRHLYGASAVTGANSTLTMALVGSDCDTIFAVAELSMDEYNTLLATLNKNTTAEITWTLTFKNLVIE